MAETPRKERTAEILLSAAREKDSRVNRRFANRPPYFRLGGTGQASARAVTELSRFARRFCRRYLLRSALGRRSHSIRLSSRALALASATPPDQRSGSDRVELTRYRLWRARFAPTPNWAAFRPKPVSKQSTGIGQCHPAGNGGGNNTQSSLVHTRHHSAGVVQKHPAYIQSGAGTGPNIPVIETNP